MKFIRSYELKTLVIRGTLDQVSRKWSSSGRDCGIEAKGRTIRHPALLTTSPLFRLQVGDPSNYTQIAILVSTDLSYTIKVVYVG
jgi:hypothetical protein